MFNDRHEAGSHRLIIAPFLNRILVLAPGSRRSATISEYGYRSLASLPSGAQAPDWFAELASRHFSVDLADAPLTSAVLIRRPADLGFVRASYELNLGCNYDCAHCYLGDKKFGGLELADRFRLLDILRDAGVIFIQLTGGELLIDPWFVETYARAFELGMMISVSSNGYRLGSSRTLNLLKRYPAYSIALSVYGATAQSYDSLTGRRGAFRRFIAGIEAGVSAGLPIKLNIIVTKSNEHEVVAMEDLARLFGLPFHTFGNMSPTVQGGAAPLLVQSAACAREREPFAECNAGRTFSTATRSATR